MEANEPIRKRIVIDLDSPPGGGKPGGYTPRGYTKQPGRSRRWPKVLAILALLIVFGAVAAVAGGYFWWRHYQTTPAYSLALIIDAAQRNDMAALQKHLDDDAIAKNMVTDVSQKAAGRYGIALNSSLQKQIDTAVPTLLPSLKQTIQDEVAKEIKAFASKSEPKPFVLVVLAVPSLVTITTQGDLARATAPLPNRKIEFALQRNGEQWKVTEFKDDVLTQRVVDSVMKDLPSIGGIELNSPLLKALRKPRKR
jgi:uncharacterized membrane protein